tara:strand:+ start:183 stop:1286 length:1104 start_codon:yes stop_codon:yes gene_type:complete
MSGLHYNETTPLNSKLQYEELETVDMILDFPDKKLVLGSVRLEGTILCETSTGSRNTTQSVAFDGQVGIHNIVDSVNVEIQNVGVIENISSDYGRYVKVLSVSSLDDNDYFQAQKAVELRSPSQRSIREITRGHNIGGGEVKDISFSFKPHICLNNNAGGDGVLSYRKTGYVKISINLNRNSNFFYGTDVSNTQRFVIKNLKCKYMTVDDDGKDADNLLKTTFTLKNSLNSSNANVSSKVPAVCSGCTMSFLSQADENSLTGNNLQLQRPENVKQVQYLFNDTNRFITYTLQNEEEYLQHALSSLKQTGVSGVNRASLKANNAFLLGTRFEGLIDLSVNNFNLNMVSDITSGSPYLLFQIFHSQTTI